MPDQKNQVERVPKSFVATIRIAVPQLSEQESIVKAIEEERAIVESNKRLIEIFEGKIKAKIAEVWEE